MKEGIQYRRMVEARANKDRNAYGEEGEKKIKEINKPNI
jgi:hypothetical protein